MGRRLGLKGGGGTCICVVWRVDVQMDNGWMDA